MPMTVPRFSAGSSANAVPAIAQSTKTADVAEARGRADGKNETGRVRRCRGGKRASRRERLRRAVEDVDLARSDFRRRSKAPVGGHDRRRAGSGGRRGADGRCGRTGKAPKERGANHGDLSSMLREVRVRCAPECTRGRGLQKKNRRGASRRVPSNENAGRRGLKKSSP